MNLQLDLAVEWNVEVDPTDWELKVLVKTTHPSTLAALQCVT